MRPPAPATAAAALLLLAATLAGPHAGAAGAPSPQTAAAAASSASAALSTSSTGTGAPENITVTFLSPTAVRVAWDTPAAPAVAPPDKFDVTYRPTNARYTGYYGFRVVAVVAGDARAVTLSGLRPAANYQLTVAAVRRGRRLRSRPVVFRTLAFPESADPPAASPPPPDSNRMADPAAAAAPTQKAGNPGRAATAAANPGREGNPGRAAAAANPTRAANPANPGREGNPGTTPPTHNPAPTGGTAGYPAAQDLPVDYPQTSSTVRGVEIGIVLLVLLVWIAAIALFFNRWGKIRMLLPYQPDYKQEQLKVPGTAACAAALAKGDACVHHSGTNICQQFHAIPPRKPRPRINSAIFVSNSGPGLDPQEFFRRHGSVSRLCRRARSADNISSEGGDGECDDADAAPYYQPGGLGPPQLSVSGPSPPEEPDAEPAETERFLA